MSVINKAPLSASPYFSTNIAKVLRFLLKHTGGNREVAQEVLQDTLISAYKSYHTFKSKSSFFTWVCKIALNKLADYYRSQVRHQSHFVVPAIDSFNQIIDPKISVEEKLVLDEFKSKINQCLNLLPREYKDLLTLKYYEDLSNREISLKLKIPGRSLEGKLYRAKKLLAKIYAGSK